MATPIQTAFQLTGADGGPLRGDVRTAGLRRPAVVICHGFKGFKGWGYFPVIADRLARAGFSVVSFNFSGSGVGEDGERFSEPERFGRSTYSGQLTDLQVVLDALSNGALGIQPSAVGLLGHSMGGAIAVLQAARDERVRALITWAATARFGRLWRPDQVPDWRRTGRIDVVNQRTGEILPLYTDVLDDLERHREVLDVGRAAARVRVPWLIAHGAADESVPLEDARTLHAGNAAAELLLLEGTGHTFGIKHPWNGSSPAFERLSEATVEWFARQLLR
jgi:pimeloyl-ACP methyl ester carboxylesterase